MKLVKEEMKWKQREKQHWLKHGDQNTKFYHMYANQRKKTNRISWVQAPNGTMVTGQDQIGDVFSTFFSKIFMSTNSVDFGSCLQDLDSCVTNEMNQMLMDEYTKKEDQDTIFLMNPLGARAQMEYVILSLEF